MMRGAFINVLTTDKCNAHWPMVRPATFLHILLIVSYDVWDRQVVQHRAIPAHMART